MLVASLAGSWPAAPGGLAVEIEQRRETRRFAADDGERQRQAERAGAGNGLRRAADGDPDRQLLLVRARIDAAVVDRRAVRARPGDALAFVQRQKQVELLGEEFVIVFEVVAEQREGFDERAASGHDLGAAARQKIERRELLEDAHRIVGRKHGDGAGELDAAGALGRRGERHDRRRGGIVRPVVLAEAEHVEPDLVGQFDLLDEVAQALVRTDRAGPGTGLTSAKV